ncbi:hypothetical protein ACO1PF_11970 [Alkalibacterium sp. f15]|uniref:hypothetical protein n=1 Tax=Alkalibacterium sp. f15 TaxID=3414029 RepID=UPI003BF7DCB2
MKKPLAYLGIAFLSMMALVMIGVVVITFMITKIDGANERLAVREEKRSSLEDGWLSAHGNGKNITLHIENVEIEGTTGTLEWFESEGGKGTVHFEIKADDTISYLTNRSNFPENVTSYPMYFRQAIESAIS